MKRRPFFAVLILTLSILGGCAGAPVNTATQDAQDPNFRPKRVYSVDMNQAWDLTLKAMNREGIALEVANKETGVIRTDYQNLSAWERNKCDIRFSQEPQKKTYIYVRCRHEGRKETTESFRDFTYSSPQAAMKAEEELYRKLEPHILPFEQTSPPQEEVVAKAAPKADPALIPEKPAQKAEAAAPAAAPAVAPAVVGPAAAAEPKAKAVSPSAPPVVAETKPEAPPPPVAPKKEAAAPPPVPASKSEFKEETISKSLETSAPANVRLAPSIRSPIVAILKKGEKVKKIGESGNWSKIKLPSGEDAWVFTDFLQPSSGKSYSITSAPAVKAPPRPVAPPPPAAAKAPEPPKKGVEGTAKVFFLTNEITKMRAEPNLKSKVTLVLKKGRKVERLDESGEFVKVRLSWGDSGWVQKRYLVPAP